MNVVVTIAPAALTRAGRCCPHNAVVVSSSRLHSVTTPPTHLVSGEHEMQTQMGLEFKIRFVSHQDDPFKFKFKVITQIDN